MQLIMSEIEVPFLKRQREIRKSMVLDMPGSLVGVWRRDFEAAVSVLPAGGVFRGGYMGRTVGLQGASAEPLDDADALRAKQDSQKAAMQAEIARRAGK